VATGSGVFPCAYPHPAAACGEFCPENLIPAFAFPAYLCAPCISAVKGFGCGCVALCFKVFGFVFKKCGYDKKTVHLP